MENLIILLHLLIALGIIGLILLQQGKGAEMGASFGSGSSQTLFGASGSGNFFSKVTAILAFIFFVTSFSLAILAKKNAGVDDDIPALIESSAETKAPAAVDDLPTVDEQSASQSAVEGDLPEASAEAAVEASAEVQGEPTEAQGAEQKSE